MSKRYYARHNKQVVLLADTPFASGGEGQLYHVTLPKKQDWVAKIYHPFKRSLERANKMAYLQQHPPHTQEEQGAWVIDILEDKRGNFLGILMPFQRGEKLEVLCGIKLPPVIKNTWQDWALESPKALEARFHLGLQLAAVVAQLHDSQQYILVDLKPDNILVKVNGHLSLVDLDSVAVVEQGNLRFAAPMATPEYAPPEYHQEHPAFLPSWDNFSLGVILYKLFCGIHPYAATARAPYEHSNRLGQKIEEGLFVHSSSKAAFFQVIPPPHERFKTLPNRLQELFIQCFEEGHKRPEKRPTASIWCWALLDIVGDAAMIRKFRELLVDGWEHPRQPLLLASDLFLKRQVQEKWGTEKPSISFVTSAIYKKGQAALEAIETTDNDGAILQLLFSVAAVFSMMVILCFVSLYTAAVIGVLFFSIGYSILTLLIFYRQNRRARLLKKALYSYKEKQAAVTNQWQYLVQLWEEWSVQKGEEMTTSLQELTRVFKEKDIVVQQLIEERSKVYKGVLEEYQDQLVVLSLPQEWLQYSWTTIIQFLERQQANQEAARALAPLFSLEQAYKKALQQKAEVLQQTEEQLLDEVRILFDWEAFFDSNETGLSWGEQTLLKTFKAQNVPNLVAIKQLAWTASGNLEVYFEQQKLVLTKAIHPQLGVFDEVYQWYKEPLEFAHKRQLSTALDYLRARFSVLQQTYQHQLKELKQTYQAQRKAAYLPYQQTLIVTTEQLKKVEVLENVREAALLQVEDDYQELYGAIHQEIEEVLEDYSKLLRTFKTASKRHWEKLQREKSLIKLQKELAIENQKIKQLL